MSPYNKVATPKQQEISVFLNPYIEQHKRMMMMVVMIMRMKIMRINSHNNRFSGHENRLSTASEVADVSRVKSAQRSGIGWEGGGVVDLMVDWPVERRL